MFFTNCTCVLYEGYLCTVCTVPVYYMNCTCVQYVLYQCTVGTLPVYGMPDEHELAGECPACLLEVCYAGGRHEELNPVDQATVQGLPNQRNIRYQFH